MRTCVVIILHMAAYLPGSHIELGRTYVGRLNPAVDRKFNGKKRTSYNHKMLNFLFN